MDAPPLAGSELIADDFVVAEWRDGGGETSAERPIAPLHIHHEDDEAWYVLEGRLGFVRGEEQLEADAGAAVLVPRGTPHAYWNANDGPTRYVIVMTPRIAALVAAVHRPGALDRIHALFREHRSELLT